MELSKQEMELFLLFLVIGLNYYSHFQSSISKQFPEAGNGIIFKKKWNYFSIFQSLDQQQKFNKSIPIWSNESKMAFSNRIWNYFSTFQSSDQNLLLHCQGRSHREISLSILVCMSVNLKSIKLLGKLKRKIHWFCVKFNFNSYF